MTEAEWLACDDPGRMLAWRIDLGRQSVSGVPTYTAPSDRKLRLFACACARAVWSLPTDPRSRRAVEVAERYADGGATDEERHHAGDAAREVIGVALAGSGEHVMTDDVYSVMAWLPAWDVALRSAQVMAGGRGVCRVLPAPAQAALLRDLFGNPWRPAVLPREVMRCGNVEFVRCPWFTPAVLGIARRAYDERDFAALPVLADALEEAGCRDAYLLRHLRTDRECPGCGRRWGCPADGRRPGCPWCGRVLPRAAPHAKGCWALDLVLGKG